MKQHLLIIAVVATLGCDVKKSTTEVTDDHGNTLASATTIELNSVTNAKIEKIQDLDIFKIEIKSRGFLTLLSTSVFSSQGHLMDSTGALLSYFSNPRKVTVILDPGTYYLALFFDNNNIGDYSISSTFDGTPLDNTKDDYPDTRSEATRINLDSSVPVKIETWADIDYLKIVLTRHATLTATTNERLKVQGTLENSSWNTFIKR